MGDRWPEGTVLVGRDQERATLRGFVHDPSPRPTVAHLYGEPGIGKSSLIADLHAYADGRQVRVLSTSPSSGDTDVPLLALADLLGDVADVTDALPPPQRHAIDAVLDRVPPTSESTRTLVLAMRSLFDSLGDAGPLLVTIDDLQWVDQTSARVVQAAVRRVSQSPIRLVLAWSTSRSDPPSGGDLAPMVTARLPLGPLTPEQIEIVLREHGVPKLPASTIGEIAATSGGNPFYALEIAAAVLRHEQGVTGHFIPIPAEIRHDVVRARIGALSAEARELLLAAAASPRPTVPLLAEVTDVVGLSEAIDAGIVEVRSSQVRFVHPILREVVLSDASRSARHRVHRRLSDLVRDPDLRAWHLALGVDEPDERVSAQLERAAVRARAAGGRRRAAVLSGRALDLSPEAGRARRRRAKGAAQDRLALGQLDDAVALTLEIDLRDPDRHLIAAQASELRDRPRDAEASLTRAIERETRPGAKASLLRVRGVTRLTFDPAGAAKDSNEAAELDPGTVSDAVRLRIALAGVAARPRSPLDPGVTLLRGVPFDQQPLVASAEAALVDGSPSRAVAVLDVMKEEPLDPIDAYLAAVLEARALFALGDLRAARPKADTAAALASSLELGRARDLTIRAEIAASSGDEGVEEVVSHACQAAMQVPLLRARALAAGAVAKLIRRDPSAVEGLSAAGAIARRMGIDDPGFAPFLADEIEALALAGDGRAGSRTAWLESRAQQLGRTNVVSMALRSRAALLAAQGRHEDAVGLLRRSLEENGTTELRLDRGRALLALGSSLRRGGKKAAARDALDAATEIFETAGADAWARASREESRRIGGRRRAGSTLTEAEWKVARLAAAGRQNREIAAELYLSTRTVESHLSNVFSKLGVRSRTELAALVASPEEQGRS